MSVCLSAGISQNPRVHDSSVFCTCYLWPRGWVGPPLTAMRYVMYFRFCGWRNDNHNIVAAYSLIRIVVLIIKLTSYVIDVIQNACLKFEALNELQVVKWFVVN